MHIKQFLPALALAATVSAQLLAPPAATPDPKKVIATVNGKDVTIADVQKMLETTEPAFVQYYQQNPQDAIAQYFVLGYLAEEGVKHKLAEESPLKEQIAFIVNRMTMQAEVDYERNSYSVSGDKVDEYYAAHRAQYDQAKIKVIYLPFKGQTAAGGPGTPEDLKRAAQQALTAVQASRSESDTRALAEDIVKKLRAGADFAKMVEQYSEDTASRAAGGDYAVVKQGSAFPEDFRKAVFALKPGEISDPVKQPTAYYIIRLEEIGAPPFQEIVGPISDAIRNDHMNEFMKALINRFEPVVKDPDFFKKPGAPASPIPTPGK